MFWCISSGYSCSKILCKTWSDYYQDSDGCRSNGAVDRSTTECLSFVPFVGLSNFYKGNKFDGWCELLNTAMIIVSILTCCGGVHHTSNCIAVCIAYGTVFLDLAKVFHMIVIGSPDAYEIIIIITSILLLCLCCCCENSMIIPAALTTTVIGILAILRDIYSAYHADKDGIDCPFV